MRITITGATGFIGLRLVQRWLKEGHELHALGRNPGKLPSAVHFWEWADSARTDPPPESLQGSQAVVNLAGEPVAQRWNQEVKQRIRSSRVDGTGRLVMAIGALQNPPAVLVNASAVGYYGSGGDAVLTETSPPGQGFLVDVCIDWERQAEKATELGLRVAYVRTGIVLGLDGGALPQMLTPFKLGVGGKLGSGKQWMPWIHIDDIVELFDFALKNQTARGALNGSSPNPVTNEDFSAQLGHALHRPALIAVPEFSLKLLFGEMANVVLASQRAVPRAALEAGFLFRFPELSAALSQLLR